MVIRRRESLASGRPDFREGPWLVALWAVLFAVYVAGLGIDPRSGDELVYLNVAHTLVDEGELVRAPQGAGFGLLIAPAEAVGGARAIELWLAGVAALGFVLAALLARRIVPEPYASAGAALAGLSAPAIAHATAISPEMTAGTLLAGAALCAVSARDHPRRGTGARRRGDARRAPVAGRAVRGPGAAGGGRAVRVEPARRGGRCSACSARS